MFSVNYWLNNHYSSFLLRRPKEFRLKIMTYLKNRLHGILEILHYFKHNETVIHYGYALEIAL